MFTESTYKELKLFFKLTQKFSNLPFQYDEAIGKLNVFSSLKSKIWYATMLLWVFVRAVYHTGWIVHSIAYGFPSISDSTVEVFFAILFITVFSLNLVVYLKRQEFAEFLSKLLAVNKTWKSQYLVPQVRHRGEHWETGERFGDGCSLYMKLLTPSGFNGSLAFAMLFMLQPNKRLYYFHILPPPGGANKPVWMMALYAVWESYTFCWHTSIFYFLWYSQLMYTNSSNFWLSQIK